MLACYHDVSPLSHGHRNATCFSAPKVIKVPRVPADIPDKAKIGAVYMYNPGTPVSLTGVRQVCIVVQLQFRMRSQRGLE